VCSVGGEISLSLSLSLRSLLFPIQDHVGSILLGFDSSTTSRVHLVLERGHTNAHTHTHTHIHTQNRSGSRVACTRNRWNRNSAMFDERGLSETRPFGACTGLYWPVLAFRPLRALTGFSGLFGPSLAFTVCYVSSPGLGRDVRY
jgi:hypothetical protein